jgi:hypothetical protein
LQVAYTVFDIAQSKGTATGDMQDAAAAVAQLCLCKDQISSLDTNYLVKAEVVEKLETWWWYCMKDFPTSDDTVLPISNDTYLNILAR